jgi:hypothetical protein
MEFGLAKPAFYSSCYSGFEAGMAKVATLPGYKDGYHNQADIRGI